MDQAAQSEIIVVTAPRLPEAEGEGVYSQLAIDPETLEHALRLDRALAAAPAASLFRRNDSGAANPTASQGQRLSTVMVKASGRRQTQPCAAQHAPASAFPACAAA